MPSPLPARASWCLAFVAAAAALHALATGLVRPMFQVSDEIGYFALAQQHALRQVSDDITRARVMPGGQPFYNSPGGKETFGQASGALLAAAARRHDSADAAAITRLAIAACHVAVVLAVWGLARRLYPAHVEIAWVASMFAVWQPVLTSFDAGVTPDAFANALSAWALYFVACALTGRRAWLPLLGATLLAAAAFAFKDTALCVFAAIAWAGIACVWRDAGRTRALAGAVGLVGLATIAALTIRSPYIDDALARLDATRLEPGLAMRMVALLARQLVPAFTSFWTGLGNFGAHAIFVPAAWTWTVAALCAVAIAGFLRRTDAGSPIGAAAAWWAFGAGIMSGLLLHPLRVVLLHGVDDFQGRWLFPMIAPMLVALAAGIRHLLQTPRASAAAGTFAATAIGVVPLVLIVVPFFYAAFPADYHVGSLYLQGVYGKGADPARVLAFVGPLSPWLITARAMTFALTLAAAVVAVAIGAGWPRGPARTPEPRAEAAR
ncbi:MAG: hypothetical protein JNM38_22555 [Acidobacteria bacterium]|nr:hypothetical protein [Acidobacteriota bacterium]